MGAARKGRVKGSTANAKTWQATLMAERELERGYERQLQQYEQRQQVAQQRLAEESRRVEPPPDEFAQFGFNFFHIIKIYPAKCKYYTNQPAWGSLVMLFEYVNADRLLYHIKLYKPCRTTQPPKLRANNSIGARSALSEFEKFVFWLVTFHRFRGRGLMQHAADLFGIDVDTARSMYATLSLVIGRFFEGQQHPATRKQAAKAVPAKSRAKLRIKDGDALYIGDCTERFTDDPRDGALHSVMHSEYVAPPTHSRHMRAPCHDVTMLSRAEPHHYAKPHCCT